MQANINSHNFYNWFICIGGELSNFREDLVESSVNRIPLQHDNLRTKSQEIKDKYNHKFVRKTKV